MNKKTKIVFIGMSKHSFYFQRHAVKFALEQGYAPISPFGIFDYFLNDVIDRDLIRQANNNLIRISDEVWVIGPISDGVLAEIKLCKEMEKPVRYFAIVDSKQILEISKDKTEFEKGLSKFSGDL